METLIFDNKQKETTLSSTGRVFICTNEKEIQVWETPESDEKPVLVTKYQYDTIWIKPIKQVDSEVLKTFKEARIQEINDYDVSNNVNSFSLNDKVIWLSVDKRLALKTRLTAEEEAGIEDTSIWYEGYKFELPVKRALELLSSLEIYASHCYDVTAQHKANIEALITIADVGAYDITVGYPENPSYVI